MKRPRLPKPKLPKLREAQLHTFTVGLLAACAAPGVLWLHIPMGVKSPYGHMAGAWAKAMGARAGASDFLLVKDGHAVFLELKVGQGVLRPEQKLFFADARKAGATVCVARTPEQVHALLEDLELIRHATIAA